MKTCNVRESIEVDRLMNRCERRRWEREGQSGSWCTNQDMSVFHEQ